MDALLRRHQDRLWAVCRRIAGNDADAADALQEAMVLVVRRLDSFDGRSRFTTWAHRVATNACLDELRRRGRRPSLGLPDDDPDLGDGAMTVAGGEAVDDGVASRLSVDDALARLPDDFRVPVVLRDVVGHDYAEIAEILDLAPGTVRSRISRGRKRLAELLDPDLSGSGGSGTGNQTSTDERPSTQP